MNGYGRRATIAAAIFLVSGIKCFRLEESGWINGRIYESLIMRVADETF